MIVRPRSVDCIKFSIKICCNTYSARVKTMIEGNKKKYYACLLAFLSRDLSEQLDILEDVLDIIAVESDVTEIAPISDEELMVFFLLDPLILVFPEMGDQVRILENLEVRLSEDSGHQKDDLFTDDTKLDKLLKAWCCLEGDREERIRLVREALTLQSQAYCWP